MSLDKQSRQFPHPVAVFSDTFIFTTLSSTDVANHKWFPLCHPDTGRPCHLFCLDDEVAYTSFAQDYGPLNLAYTFKGCLAIFDKERTKDKRPRTLCMYTSPHSKKKANMATMACLYFLIVHHFSASAAFQPIAQMEFRPFRDAGNGPMDFGLSIQDVIWGVDRAVETSLLDLTRFDPVDYQYFERVENGDLNILSSFIPFASPMDPSWIELSRAASRQMLDNPTDKTLAEHDAQTKGMINSAKDRKHAFACVLKVLREENVGLLVRLNEDLYDRQVFVESGMEHVDMYFDDGSNPSDDIVRQFIQMAEMVIEGKGQKVAVHCKAGLGRTGVLIGAYLIYKYAFTAAEVIGYMRVVRPGMVVGPQQQYMVANQLKWAGWAARDRLVREMERHTLDNVNPLATPPMECDQPLLPSLNAPQLDILALSTAHQFSGLMEAVETVTPRQISVGPEYSENILCAKGGDAIGQPRKGRGPIWGEEYVVHPSVDIRLQTASPTFQLDNPSFTSASARSGWGAGSIRGIKRDATRIPVSQSSSTASGSPGNRSCALSIPVLLTRSGSMSSLASSVASVNDRPAKRRQEVSSPLSTFQHTEIGLSSPPPSRESSPSMDTYAGQENRPLPSSPTLGPSRIPNKLRRKVTPNPRSRETTPASPTSPPPSAVPTSTSMRSYQATTNTASQLPRMVVQPDTVQATPVLPTRRSLLPMRRVPARETRSAPPEEDVEAMKVKSAIREPTARPRKRVETRQDEMKPREGVGRTRITLTPPRFKGLMSRMGGSGSSSLMRG